MKVIPNVNYICECGFIMYNEDLDLNPAGNRMSNRRIVRCKNRCCREYNVPYRIPYLELDPTISSPSIKG